MFAFEYELACGKAGEVKAFVWQKTETDGSWSYTVNSRGHWHSERSGGFATPKEAAEAATAAMAKELL